MLLAGDGRIKKGVVTIYLFICCSCAVLVLFILWRKHAVPPDRKDCAENLTEAKDLIRHLNMLYTAWETLVIRRELCRTGSGKLSWETDGGKTVNIPVDKNSMRVIEMFDSMIADTETEILEVIPYIWKWYVSFTGKDEIPLDRWSPPEDEPETGFIFAWKQRGSEEWITESFSLRAEAFSRRTAITLERKDIMAVTDVVEMNTRDFLKKLEAKKIPVYTVEDK